MSLKGNSYTYHEVAVSTLLLCGYFQFATTNGKDASVIELLGKSPLLKSAQLKNNQILTYDIELLDVPNMNNSRINIALKHCSMRRIMETKLHRQMISTITFSDVFAKCQIADAHLQIKKDAHGVVVTLFEHLKVKGVLKSFKVTKNDNSFYYIQFVHSKK